MTNNDILDCLFIWLNPHNGVSYDTLPIGAEIGSKIYLSDSIYEVIDILPYEKALEIGWISNEDEFYDISICFVCE